jgi:hypothetical protein
MYIPRNWEFGSALAKLRKFGGGGSSTNSVQDMRENGDLGVPLNLQMNETRILIKLLQKYIPRNWEFGSALSKLWNFGWGFEPPHPRYATDTEMTSLAAYLNIVASII